MKAASWNWDDLVSFLRRPTVWWFLKTVQFATERFLCGSFEDLVRTESELWRWLEARLEYRRTALVIEGLRWVLLRQGILITGFRRLSIRPTSNPIDNLTESFSFVTGLGDRMICRRFEQANPKDLFEICVFNTVCCQTAPVQQRMAWASQTERRWRNLAYPVIRS